MIQQMHDQHVMFDKQLVENNLRQLLYDLLLQVILQYGKLFDESRREQGLQH